MNTYKTLNYIMLAHFLLCLTLKLTNVLETYNIRKLESYKGPPIVPRARLVHQREGQADYFFILQQLIKQLSVFLVERSIAGGEECSKPRGLSYMPIVSHWIFYSRFNLKGTRRVFQNAQTVTSLTCYTLHYYYCMLHT